MNDRLQIQTSGEVAEETDAKLSTQAPLPGILATNARFVGEGVGQAPGA
jgi:hypothetical protein